MAIIKGLRHRDVRKGGGNDIPPAPPPPPPPCVREIKDKNGKTRICVMGRDRKTLDPLAEAFMKFCEDEWGVEFVTVKATPVKKKKVK